MQKFLEWLDRTARTNQENITAKRLERAAFFFLILMVLAAPHSIAATQTAWILGMLAWIARFFVKPRPKFVRTPLDAALWAFFGWSVITALTSYAPDISLDKLRGAALFLIFYFVINQLRTTRAVRFLALALIFSCMVNVLWTPLERIIGRGVEVHGVAEASPLAKATVRDGDTLLKINGKKFKTPAELLEKIEQNELVKVEFYRPDYYLTVDVKKSDLLAGENEFERLGIASWKKGHNWRSMGFFGHWTTYAEVLQLVASLVFGLFVASFARRTTNKTEDKTEENESTKNQKPKIKNFLRLFPFSFSPLLLFCFAAMSFALLLNVTRASQLALIASAFSIVFLVNRKMVLVLAVILLPVAVGGLLFIQQSRKIGYFDTQDDSTRYRQTVYREGFELWTENARHFLLGVGMDSIKRYAKEWRLFDDGKLPMGHFHSTPLQLVVERGLPALLLWLWILWLYARTLWRRLDSEIRNPKCEIETGIVLGVFGGAVGFFTSGLVHYNLGDAEVAMVFFILMAFGVFLANPKSATQNPKLT